MRARGRQVPGDLFGEHGQSTVVDIACPPDVCPEETVEQEVPDGRAAGFTGEDERNRDAEPGACRCGEPGMVRLGRPGGDERVRSAVQRRCKDALQLPDLVAAAAKPRKVVALDPQLAHAHTKSGREARRGLHRGREGTEADPGCSGAVVIHAHAHLRFRTEAIR
jgi:hypothetical protein